MESSNGKVLEELKLLNNKFDKFEVDIDVTRNPNLLLLSHLVNRLSI